MKKQLIWLLGGFVSALILGAAPGPNSRSRTVTTTEKIARICATPNADKTWRVEADVEVSLSSDAPSYTVQYAPSVPAGLMTALDATATAILARAAADRP